MKRDAIEEGRAYEGRGPHLRLVEKIEHHPVGTGPVRSRDRVFVTWRQVESDPKSGMCSLTSFARWATEAITEHGLVFGCRARVTAFGCGRSIILLPKEKAEEGKRAPIHVGDTLWALPKHGAELGIPLTVLDIQTTSLAQVLGVENDPKSLGVIHFWVYVDIWNEANPNYPADSDPEVLRIQVEVQQKEES